VNINDVTVIYREDDSLTLLHFHKAQILPVWLMSQQTNVFFFFCKANLLAKPNFDNYCIIWIVDNLDHPRISISHT
jgi:hypothetical protein